MFMYKKFLLPALLLLASALPAFSATVRSYEEALRKAGDKKPIVIFSYGANYDAVSEACYESFIKKRGIARVIRDCVFLEVPVYQQPNEKEKKETERIMGGKSLPWGIWSYPSLAVVDGKGNLRGIVQMADEMKDAETASAALDKLLKAFDEQQKLILQAEKAGGSRQAALLTQAADINLRMPKQLPSGGKGSEAIDARLKFDPIAVMTKIDIMAADEANAYIRNLMADGCYSLRQRQEILAAYSGRLRRLKVSHELLHAVYIEMRNIDPTSMYAAYAEEAIRLWAQPVAEGE